MFMWWTIASVVQSHRRVRLLVALAISLGMPDWSYGQTASSGAVAGIALDPAGALLPGVTISLARKDGSESKHTISDANGRFGFLLLRPGTYDLKASQPGFKPLSIAALRIAVTETRRLELHFEVETHMEQTQVLSDLLMVQLDTAALGRTVNVEKISSLPLVNRNFVQLAGLSPGVTVGVYNAGELGTGATAFSQIGKSNDGIYVQGARSYDNNWQLDGISVTDVQGSGSISGGIPVPNPDALQEFKLQTGLYDAAFGRGAGANVSVVTRSGSNAYHGSIFEFLRNDILNANDFFLNRTNQRRPELKQNQFGFALGGPLIKDKLLAFSSYQGTRQTNGIAAGQSRIACTASLNAPPITNDRSRQALGQLFGGMTGALGGVAINPDGSNINPVALALLNLKQSDGSFLIPTPQTVDPSKPFATRGFSAFTQPCTFDENQGLANLDYLSQKSQFAARFFLAQSDQLVTFPGGALNPAGNIQGFSSPGDSQFMVASLSHSYVLSSAMLNEARIGFNRTSTTMSANAPFKWSDVGVLEGELNRNNELPSLNILGSVSMASVIPRTYTQNSFGASDVFSWLKGAHALKFGGSLTRMHVNLDFAGAGSSLQFLSWPDFLLGLDGSANGTGTFSNVFGSGDIFGLLNREFRVWEGSAFAQDDYRITRRLTLNGGLRYERVGHFGDELGRSSSFDIAKANPNPPPSGTLEGYIVASNFSAPPPPGVTRADNTFGNYGEGQNVIAPRFGFAWQILPTTNRLVLRGGYGVYYSRPTGQVYTQTVLAAPFALTRQRMGLANAAATFQAPFAQPFPTSDSFPLFVPYSPGSANAVNALAPDFRPAMIQQFSLNTQAELHRGWLLETAYVGSRGTHLQRFRSLNQALEASPGNSIRGVISNTLANIGLRVPIPGIRPSSLRVIESEGSSWYNAFQGSLTKALNHGVQFLASYTFSKALDTDGADINSTSAGTSLTLGDQNSPERRWGRASFDRTHRFVFSTTWTIPSPPNGALRALAGGWSVAAVATIQSGNALTIGNTNSTNVFGISDDRAQLTGACSQNQLATPGPVGGRLNAFFNRTCFTSPPIIGADGIGTDFGNSGTGVVNGPAQQNLDLSFSKTVGLNWPSEQSNLQFRAEFYNALNHPQFANPDTNFSSPTFGVINSTAVNARVGQLAIKYSF